VPLSAPLSRQWNWRATFVGPSGRQRSGRAAHLFPVHFSARGASRENQHWTGCRRCQCRAGGFRGAGTSSLPPRRSSIDVLPFFARRHSGSPTFRWLVSYNRCLQGNPRQAAKNSRSELRKVVGENAIARMRVIGWGGRAAARALEAGFESEFRALARSIRPWIPKRAPAVSVHRRVRRLGRA
jgi:hypothetical protein